MSHPDDGSTERERKLKNKKNRKNQEKFQKKHEKNRKLFIKIKKMSVTLHTTLGDIKLEIFCDTAPRTSFNFLALAASGYYNGCMFHRNIADFMIQGGDPTGTGKGGDSIWGGTFNDEFNGATLHDARGVVSMANKGPNTNRSQFFITYSSQTHLDNVYSVFGRVIGGFEVLTTMENLPMSEKKKHRPLQPPVIDRVTIHANPFAEEGIVYPSKTGPPAKVH